MSKSSTTDIKQMPVEYLMLFLAAFTLISIGFLHPLGIVSFVAFVMVFTVHFCHCDEDQEEMPVETPVENPPEAPVAIQTIIKILQEPDDFEIV